MALPETLPNNLMEWFKQAIAWLHEDGTPEAPQRPHAQLLEQMENSRLPKKAWEYIEELDELTLTADPSERGEVMFRCAKMAVGLGNLKDALRLCNEAENKYATSLHQRAVVLWMIGAIQWETRQDVRAIASWRSAITHLKTRQSNPQTNEKTRNWYTRVIPRLEIYLTQAIRDERLPTFVNDSTLFRENRGASNSANGPTGIPVSFDSLRWLAVDIFGSVPAGGFSPVEVDPEIGNPEITEIMIGNELYKVHSTKRNSLWQNSVMLNPSDKYHTVRVKGTSMNDSKPVRIEDGDYILVRQQNDAADNEIVIAAILDTEPLATVKRLKKFPPNIIQLHPESKDDSHYQNPNFGRDLNPREVNIVGVVEAVFKKKTG